VDELARGRVVSFDLRKKFGFVAIECSTAEAFLHISVLKDAGFVTVPIGTTLTFEFKVDDRRRITRIVEVDTGTALPGQPAPVVRKTRKRDGKF
jgi:cold shock CspA family protein